VLKAVVILAAALAGAALAVVPALADSQTVTAGSSTWDKTQVAIKPGESVTFSNPAVGGGFHNLYIDGAQVQSDGTGWSKTVTSLGAGQHSYECTIHAAMKGTIFVNNAGTVPSSGGGGGGGTTPTGTSPGGGGSPPGGGGSSPAGTAPATGPESPGDKAPSLDLPKRRLGTLRRSSVTFTVNTDEDARLHIALSSRAPGARRFRRFGAVDQQVTAAANPNRVHFTKASWRKLGPGAYRMSVVATDLDGNAAAAETLSFAIR
jgi:plastocyanin